MDMERDSGEKLPTAKKPIIRQSSLLSYFISRVKETNIKDSCKDSPMDISLSLEQEIPMSQETLTSKLYCPRMKPKTVRSTCPRKQERVRC